MLDTGQCPLTIYSKVKILRVIESIKVPREITRKPKAWLISTQFETSSDLSHKNDFLLLLVNINMISYMNYWISSTVSNQGTTQ